MPTADVSGRLFRLSDTDLTVAGIDEDVRGRKAYDSSGEEIGTVDDLLIDDVENKVRFLRLGSGGFLGMGKDHFLVPVDAVTAVSADAVTVDRERGRLTDVPGYDPEITYDPAYYADLYGWWGYGPFWGAGYVYPPYPYYR